MRIVTWNVNGLRAAIKKGFAGCLDALAPDVLLLQEVRALPEQLPGDWAAPAGWHVVWHPAQRKGYAGTAVWSRHPIEDMAHGIGEPDGEGRILRVRVAGLELVSVYLPSGSSGDERQQVKEAWMDQFRPWADGWVKQRTPVVLGGDFNIAHTERDIFYAKSNENASGFLPHERAWMGDLLQSGWRDFVRMSAGDVQGPYSWWSNRGQARALDRGWRIDYLLGNAALHRRFESAWIHRDGGLTISDHAPVVLDLKG